MVEIARQTNWKDSRVEVGLGGHVRHCVPGKERSVNGGGEKNQVEKEAQRMRIGEGKEKRARRHIRTNSSEIDELTYFAHFWSVDRVPDEWSVN